MLAPIQGYPTLWLLAAINFTALVIAVTGAFALSLKKKRWEWFPIGAALLLAHGLFWASRLRSGRIPVVPYIAVESTGTESHPWFSINVHYTVDFVILGVALGVIMAMRQKK